MRPLVFFDLETTGVSIETDRIVDIAMIRRGVGRDAGSKQVLSSLVNPEVPIPAAATAIPPRTSVHCGCAIGVDTLVHNWL